MEMVEVRTADLIDGALNWAVAKAECLHPFILSGGMYCGTVVAIGNDNTWSPSTNWSQGGPLIEKFILELKFCVFELPQESWKAETHTSWANGSTALISSMRAIVHAILGEIVSVPKELMK